jgi:TonB family protein
MMRFSYIAGILLLVCFLHVAASAQSKDKIEAISKISHETILKDCKNLKAGRVVSFPKPDYPAQARVARIGGTISVAVKIDVKGKVSEIEAVSGHKFLQSAAAVAARKAKFSPAICDSAPAQFSAVLTYNFIPYVSTESYFSPVKIEEFADLKAIRHIIEAVLNLTDNYKFAFGYADKRFYADAPLTRGDFAQFLRLTLDLLSERAAAAKKLPREIGLFYPHNPQKTLSADSIKDLKSNAPFYESIKILLLKYDVALTMKKASFRANFI